MKKIYLLTAFLTSFLLTNSYSQSQTFSKIGVGTSYSSSQLVNLKRGWGDYIKFRTTQNSGYFALHHPPSSEELEWYYSGSSGSVYNILSIFKNGKVSVGANSTPGDYKLYVSGGILTEKLRIAIEGSSKWADYVFNDDYELMNLNELEQYIIKHKHLPNIPTTSDVINDGVEVGEITAKLLEKIEELSLHIISLNKRISELEKSNNQ